ncbi:MAG: c-type cytochrome biogenesis protein CcmI [Sneathiella sp.]|nr:c-type cytochrome biogenesis protein CcmI [Sneathiella sp.]
MIWLILTLISLVALAILAYPLFSSKLHGISRSEGGLSVYTHQLKELEADVVRGVLTEMDAEPVKLEIQRRLLLVSKQDQRDQKSSKRRLPGVAVSVLIAVPLATFALYWFLGSPDLVSKPLASRDIEQEKTALVGRDLGDLVKRLTARLAEDPRNLDGWILLARTLSRMGRYHDAATTYLQATTIAGEDADLYVGAGENFYFQAEGVISEASLEAFSKAFEIDSQHPGARYYLALRDAQIGNEEKALESWIALYTDSDPNAAFMRIVRGRIQEMANDLGRDVTLLLASKPLPQSPQPGPSSEEIKAASNMSVADRQAMIQNMVTRLATRMEETPEFDGLMRLGQVYGTLRQFDKSADAYGLAANLQQDNPAPLSLQAFAFIQTAEEGAPPPDAAVALYQRVLKMNDKDPEALWYLGISEARANNRQTALKHWNKLLSLAPEDSQLRENVSRAINALSQSPQN